MVFVVVSGSIISTINMLVYEKNVDRGNLLHCNKDSKILNLMMKRIHESLDNNVDKRIAKNVVLQQTISGTTMATGMDLLIKQKTEIKENQ